MIEEAIRDCRAVVAVVTPRWGQDLADPEDWVRRELSSALAAGKPIVPALLDGAPAPARSALPADLAPLADRNAVTLAAADFRDDVGRLIEALERLGVEPATRTAFADVPKSARVEARAAWDAADDPEHARERLMEALAAHGIRASGERGADLRLTGGNKLKARLLGSLHGPESRLPLRGLLRVRDRGGDRDDRGAARRGLGARHLRGSERPIRQPLRQGARRPSADHRAPLTRSDSPPTRRATGRTGTARAGRPRRRRRCRRRPCAGRRAAPRAGCASAPPRPRRGRP